MLATIQIPVADARPFVDVASKLERPTWPLPLVGHEFVRAVGAVRTRTRDGVAPWSGEDVFADARRAVRFPPSGQRPLAVAGVVHVRPAFRRLFSDGRAVTRLEAGFRLRPQVALQASDLLRLVDACASYPIDVVDRGSRARRPLLDVPLPLARLLLHATSHALDDPAWRMAPGAVAMVLDATLAELPALPPQAQFIDIPVAGARLSWSPIVHRGRPLSVWCIQQMDGARSADVRRLRIHLLRLHAERECLKQILRLVVQGRIAIARGSAESELLQAYLDDALRLLQRDFAHGIRQRAILSAAQRADGLVAEGAISTLLQQLQTIRGSLLRRVAAAVTPAPPQHLPFPVLAIEHGIVQIEDRRTMNDYSTHIGEISGGQIGAIGHHALVVDSIKSIQGSNADETLRTTLNELVGAAAALSASLGADDGERLLQDANALVREAASEAPRGGVLRAYLETLTSAAGTVAEAGTPLVALAERIVHLLG